MESLINYLKLWGIDAEYEPYEDYYILYAKDSGSISASFIKAKHMCGDNYSYLVNHSIFSGIGAGQGNSGVLSLLKGYAKVAEGSTKAIAKSRLLSAFDDRLKAQNKTNEGVKLEKTEYQDFTFIEVKRNRESEPQKAQPLNFSDIESYLREVFPEFYKQSLEENRVRGLSLIALAVSKKLNDRALAFRQDCALVSATAMSLLGVSSKYNVAQFSTNLGIFFSELVKTYCNSELRRVVLFDFVLALCHLDFFNPSFEDKVSDLSIEYIGKVKEAHREQ